MKKIAVLAGFLALISCNNNTPSTPTGNKEMIISELKNLSAGLLSNNADAVAGFIDFPMTLDNILVSDKNQFVRDYDSVFYDLEILKEIFENLNIDDLQAKDSIEKKIPLTDAPCENNYSITIKENLVEISNSLQLDTINTHNAEESCMEVDLWHFELKNDKLKFKSHEFFD